MPPPDRRAAASDTAQKTAPKLSITPRGHWRSRWRSQKDCQFSDRMEKAGEWLGRYRWPSAEVAEQKALDWLKAHPDVARHYGIVFLDVVFFPAGSEDGS